MPTEEETRQQEAARLASQQLVSSGGQRPSDGGVKAVFSALVRSPAASVKLHAVEAGVSTDEQDDQIMAELVAYAKDMGLSEKDGHTAMLMAWIQSGVSHTTSPKAQVDATLVVTFEYRGKQYVFSKKDFNSRLRAKLGPDMNHERRFLRKRSTDVLALLHDAKLSDPVVAASNHGAMDGFEKTAVDFFRLKPGSTSDENRASNALIKRNALHGKGGAATRMFNISQLIDAAGK